MALGHSGEETTGRCFSTYYAVSRVAVRGGGRREKVRVGVGVGVGSGSREWEWGWELGIMMIL